MKIQFNEKDWKTVFVWSWQAFYPQKWGKNIIVNCEKDQVKSIMKWKKYKIDKKKKSISIL